jgi:cytoskeletal protein CcmA (bactofilin family)
MARREDILGVSGADTVIGAGVNLEGEVKAEGDVMIDGHLKGTLSAGGAITIGVNAVVKAPVRAASVMVAGHLTGDIVAEGEVQIMATGQVKGNITSGGLALEMGAVFIGRSAMPENRVLGTTHEDAAT